jgi:endonuclease/exonuclease/phosphatase family metal-dependent hydrolase
MSDRSVVSAGALCVVTFNVLMDFLPAEGVPPWEERKTACAQVLRAARADLIGVQEPSPQQLAYLEAQLPEFDLIVVRSVLSEEVLRLARPHYGPDVPPVLNEVALFYRPATLEKLGEGHWWLSPTPDQPVSIGFGNIAPRLVVWGRFRHSATGRPLVVFNTHFDLRAPRPMAEVCRARFQAFALNEPLIFMGDFNVDPDQNAEVYTLLTADGWRDAYAAVPPPPANGTYQDSTRIDHVLYRGPALAPVAWATLPAPDPAHPLSDHHPVLVQFTRG